ncbi:MAG: sigma-54-dependent Fis family transcriptional regulator [Myxococcales bacterium]|nr:sigma-54-dependent Fis family transcriptional regulator [Myxococcales bacterium]
MFRAIVTPGAPEVGGALYEAFRAAYHEALASAWAVGLPEVPPELAFALLWQLRRGFHFIHRRLLGGSPAAAALRAAVWQSVFTHDLGRYRRGLYGRMHEIPTLILGPSGTGKELVAGAIGASRFIPFDPRKRRFEADHVALFLPVHLAALAESLVEAELFGHDKGAFTGAHQARAGHLEGRDPAFTVFLDEIGEVPLSLQVKLLRVLQTREFFRVGGTEPRRFEGKVIAATHRDLPELVRAGAFREDLYFRLRVLDIRLPPLRERPEDLPQLADHLLAKACHKVGRSGLSLSPEALAAMAAHPWPGNVREMENAIERAVILADDLVIDVELLGLERLQTEHVHLDEAPTDGEDGEETTTLDLSLEDYFRQFVLQHQHELSETDLAKRLGISRKALWERRQKLGIPRR